VLVLAGLLFMIFASPTLTRTLATADLVDEWRLSLQPVIVGGGGPRRTPALAARFATEFNITSRPFGEVDAVFEVVREAARGIGRDPLDLVYSVAYATFAGATDAEAARRAAAVGRADVDPGEALVGTAAQIVDRLGELRETGTTRVYLQILDLHDLDHLDFLAREVIPQLR
jgi:alkanesulfonate monooxygenase SsuD/methylene tetrahydromethanopterin reductase-like flavin-dependent oxidoreductase (luciferase family)